MSDLEPACIEVIKHVSHRDWESATPSDLKERTPCKICFSGEFEPELEDAVVSTHDGERLHRATDSGPIDFSELYGSEHHVTRQLLIEMDPSDLPGLSEAGGGA